MKGFSRSEMTGLVRNELSKARLTQAAFGREDGGIFIPSQCVGLNLKLREASVEQVKFHLQMTQFVLSNKLRVRLLGALTRELPVLVVSWNTRFIVLFPWTRYSPRHWGSPRRQRLP